MMCDISDKLRIADETPNHSSATSHQTETRRASYDISRDASCASSDSDDEDDLQRFTAVLEALKLEIVPTLASRVRRLRGQSNISAKVITPPLSGSYHVLFRIDFADGVRWILKVPSLGTHGKWTTSAAGSLVSEASTMRLLRRETTVPVPQVFEFASDLNNELGVPFILMEWIDGCSLEDVWFDIHATKAELKARRSQTLHDIASAMNQLSRFSFKRGGSVIFDKAGAPSAIGPTRFVDNHAMLARLDLGGNDADGTVIYAEAGPFKDYKSYYTAGLGRWPKPKADWQKGDLALLRLFLEMLPESDGSSTAPFVLTHPDFDIQNVLVSRDGRVKALIDWDGVCAVPWSVGSERYPSWLTRDWDPAKYNYQRGMETDPNIEGCREDSPETLAFYRKMYADLIGQTKGKADPKKALTTRQSIVFENLLIAVDDPLCTHDILVNLFNKVNQALPKHQSDELEYRDLTKKIAQGKCGKEVLSLLRGGFNNLLAGYKDII